MKHAPGLVATATLAEHAKHTLQQVAGGGGSRKREGVTVKNTVDSCMWQSYDVHAECQCQREHRRRGRRREVCSTWNSDGLHAV